MAVLSSSDSSSYVRVWYWPGRGISSSGYSPGHVALEMHKGGENNENYYASFWPGKCRSPENCQETESHFHEKLDTDQFLEDGKRGEDFKLVSLRIDTMIQAFLDFKRRKHYIWSETGSGIFRKSYARNCAGLTLYLLEAGGIKQLLQDQKPSNQTTGSVGRRLLGYGTGIYLTYLSYNSFQHLSTLAEAPALQPLLDFHYLMSNFALSPPSAVEQALNALYKPSYLSRITRLCLNTLISGFNPVAHLASYVGLPGLNTVLEKKEVLSSNIIKNYYELIKIHLDLGIKLKALQKDINNINRESVEILLRGLKNAEVKQVIQEEMTDLAQISLDFSTKVYKANQTSEKIIALATRLFVRIEKHYSYAAIAALVPIGISLTFILMNSAIWTQTITPDDVKRIVAKALAKERESKKS
jgi:hypothetical protein